MTYRTGNHHGVTIVSEGDGARCGRPDHDCQRGHLVAVVIDGGTEGDQALAERICALLNADDESENPPDHEDGFFLLDEVERLAARAESLARRRPLLAPRDSCTCTIVGADPDCPVHHGRRARGPKPPPVGPGCICDGSGRTCPRHGTVI